ncbi:MAG: class I poly(R)-hydroxyalkanoic acid synthase [Pseudomonadota bacterium]|nr:class I poly(R)-hydroxyalkanoic acid synthase [Pseudomonadota bacterium]
MRDDSSDLTRDLGGQWSALGTGWQALASDWSRWWTTAATRHGAAAAASATSAVAGAGTPVAEALDHAQSVAALNARYQPRFQALWIAAQQAMLHPQGGLPAIAESRSGDRRFLAPEWNALPYFALLKQHYLLTSEYLRELAALAPLPASEKRRIDFMTRQLIDAMAPSNFPATNPEVWKLAIESNGASLRSGIANILADARKGRISMSDEAAFELGRNIAITPGSVVYRNAVMELIQYAPTTARVHKRPLVISPPCINKYYILDLQPENSFVRWAVGEGHTVFMISWRNIPEPLGHLTWEDYVDQGVLTALDVVRKIAKSSTVNALGFCVGGAILACALAVLRARGDRTVASASFLTTLLDYTDPGDIGVFVSPEFLSSREPALMGGQRVKGGELATAFASLRANELVWNYVVSNYLKGQAPPAFDLLYWNSDSSNLPGPMYVYYLRNMYIENRLREPGALELLGEPVDLSRIDVPTYVYASREDHIVPWHSAYATTALVSGDVVFTLGASGHIAGVVNPPAKHKRSYWVNASIEKDPDRWLAGAEEKPGSWWSHWGAWLARRGGGERAAPRKPGNAMFTPLLAAPGTYVKEVVA